MSIEKKIVVVEEEETAITIVEKKQAVAQPTPHTMTELRDRYQKLVYLIDESGSMSSRMPQDIEGKEFPNCTVCDGTGKRKNEWQVSEENPEGLVDCYYCDGKGKDVPYLSKVDCVKTVMKRFIEQRFKKYSDALVGLTGFEGTGMQHQYCVAGSSKDQVLGAVDRLRANGSTDIFSAVDFGLRDCEIAKSPVGSHHIVLVSDGMDRGAEEVAGLVNRMKEQNVIFDFIFIKGKDAVDLESGYGIAIKALKATTSATGGEYFEVSSDKDFEQKFFEVSLRPALPPYRG